MAKDIIIDLEKLRSYLDAYFVISDELFALLCKSFSIVSVGKGEEIIIDKHERKKLYFVYEGICAFYYYKKEKECIVDFVKDGEFGVLSHCLCKQKNFELCFKSLNPSVILVLSYDNFLSMWETQNEFTRLFCNVMETYLTKVEMFQYHSRYCTAKERICYFLQDTTGNYLMLNIPRYYVASYLGISPETFSSILGELSKGNKIKP